MLSNRSQKLRQVAKLLVSSLCRHILVASCPFMLHNILFQFTFSIPHQLYEKSPICTFIILHLPFFLRIKVEFLFLKIRYRLASWLSGNAFVSGARGLRFKSRAGQIGHSVANGSPPLRHFFERSCVARAQWRGDGPRQLVTRFGVIQRV